MRLTIETDKGWTMQQHEESSAATPHPVQEALDRAFEAVDKYGFTPATAKLMQEALDVCEKNGIIPKL